MKDTILVTGASGYVGKILLEKLIKKESVEKIICIDKDDLRNDLKKNEKIVFIHKNLVDDWESDLKDKKINKIIHLAWQIREMYGNRTLQNKWNIDGSQKVFDYFFKNPDCKNLVHFSTVASYGAYPENTFSDLFSEDKKFRKTDYLYAEEKRIVEENLRKSFLNYLPHFEKNESKYKSVYIIRPASITGPIGRSRSSFGLQSALSGKIAKENFLFKMISKVLQFMPGTRLWARQFVNEEDIANAAMTLSDSNRLNEYKVYNLCPEKTYLDAKMMSKILNKKVIYFHPRLVQILCFFAWHLTRGKIPTGRGVWKAYSYPIIVDGSKIEKDFNFKYSKNIVEAITQ